MMAQVRISIVFESGARIGPGKAKLLESIRDTGSISAAGRDMGMSISGRGSCSTASTKPLPNPWWMPLPVARVVEAPS
jgi:hypothetical protein